MADKQTAPGAVTNIRVSQIECDYVSGPLRCVARLGANMPRKGVKAIWRNETGTARFTAARSA